MVSFSNELHEYDQTAVKPFASFDPPSSQSVHTSLHEDIVYTLKSLRYSRPFDIPIEELPFFPKRINKVSLAPSSAQLQLFNPDLMPFAARWIQQKDHRLQASAPRTDRNFVSARQLSQLERHLDHPHVLPIQPPRGSRGSGIVYTPFVH